MEKIRDHLAFLLVAALLYITPQLVAQVFTEDFKALPVPVENCAIDNYGISVSVDGDYAVVGAISDTGRGPGYANVLHNTGSSWEIVARLTASDGEGGKDFGKSVCISGDVVVIGAVFNDDRGGFSGSAYVFEKPAGGWVDMTETAKLNSSDAVYDFGNSASISGDVIVIGASPVFDTSFRLFF